MATIDDLHARVPDVQCKGLCAEFCGPIGCSVGEAERMEAVGDAPLTFTREGACGFLKDGRCSVYSVRPLVCRLFGAVAGETLLQCPHGCKPKEPLSKHAARALVEQMRRVGGPDVFSRFDLQTAPAD